MRSVDIPFCYYFYPRDVQIIIIILGDGARII